MKLTHVKKDEVKKLKFDQLKTGKIYQIYNLGDLMFVDDNNHKIWMSPCGSYMDTASNYDFNQYEFIEVNHPITIESN